MGAGEGYEGPAGAGAGPVGVGDGLKGPRGKGAPAPNSKPLLPPALFRVAPLKDRDGVARNDIKSRCKGVAEKRARRSNAETEAAALRFARRLRFRLLMDGRLRARE